MRERMGFSLYFSSLMHEKRKRILFHILFWVISWLFLAWFLTRLTREYHYTFFLSSLLWVIALGTTHVFNYVLIPLYLLTKRYLLLALFTLFCLVISLWLELLGIVALFYYLLTVYSTGEKGIPFLIDPVFLIAGLYLVVIGGVMFRLIRISYAMQTEKHTLENLKLEAENKFKDSELETAPLIHSGDTARSCLTIRSDRKEILIPMAEILYLQAMGDYVIIFRESGDKHMTIETLTRILQRLPENEFVRIHRTYIVNKQKISAIGSHSVEIGKLTLPVSKNYITIKESFQF